MVTAVVCIALGAVSAAMASLNVAIPDLVRSTHASQTQLEWIIDAYLLVFSGPAAPGRSLGDRYGRRRASSPDSSSSGPRRPRPWPLTSANELIVLRGLIGLGAAFVMPATLSTITGTFPPAERTKAVERLGGGRRRQRDLGLLCERRPAPMVLLAGRLRRQRRPRRRRPGRHPPLRPRVLPAGRARRSTRAAPLLATVGLVAFVFSIIEAPDAGWTERAHARRHGRGLVALGGFVRLRAPPGTTRSWTRACSANRRLSAGSLSICIQFFAFFGFTFVSLQYLEGVRGYSPLVAALAVLPLSATMMPAARLTSRLTARFGARAVCVTGLRARAPSGWSSSRGSGPTRLICCSWPDSSPSGSAWGRR